MTGKMLTDTTEEIKAKLEKLEKEKTHLVSNMTNVDLTQQKLKESVSGLEEKNIEFNKRLIEINKEQDELRGELYQSNTQNLEFGIKLDSLQSDQQQMQSKIEILQLVQQNTTEYDIAGMSPLYIVIIILFKTNRT